MWFCFLWSQKAESLIFFVTVSLKTDSSGQSGNSKGLTKGTEKYNYKHRVSMNIGQP